jgi:hypothetical protein
MKVDEYKVLVMVIENGVNLGWNRAHKHSDTPEEHYIKNCIEEAIMLELCEYFNFDDDGDSAVNQISGVG